MTNKSFDSTQIYRPHTCLSYFTDCLFLQRTYLFHRFPWQMPHQHFQRFDFITAIILHVYGTALIYPFPKWQILDSSKLKEIADDNFKLDENGRTFFKWVENTGKRRNCLSRAISPFPTVFSKDLNHRHVKTRACLGKGYMSHPLTKGGLMHFFFRDAW